MSQHGGWSYIQLSWCGRQSYRIKHLINTSIEATAKKGMQVLVDSAELFQGQKEWRERNRQDTPVPAHEIDTMISPIATLTIVDGIPRLRQRRLPRQHLRHHSDN